MNDIKICQQTRQQALNRYYARQTLCEKLERKILGRKSAAERSVGPCSCSVATRTPGECAGC